MPIQYVSRIPCSTVNVQLACDGEYVAIPSQEKNISILQIGHQPLEVLLLKGHHRCISALCLSAGSQGVNLYSAASDYVILWDINELKSRKEHGAVLRGEVIATALGDIVHISTNFHSSEVAVSVDNEIHIVGKKISPSVLKCHSARVNCTAFCPHYNSTLLSTGDDRTFCVWDVSSSTLLYQSTIISASPFICIAMDPSIETCAIGSADGKVRFIDLTDGNNFRLLHQFDIHKRNRQLQNYHTADETGVEEQCVVVSLCYARPFTQVQPPSDVHPAVRENTFMRHLNADAPILCVVTNQELLQIHSRSLDVLDAFQFQQLPTSCGISSVANAAIGQGWRSGKVWSVVSSYFQSDLHLLSIDCTCVDPTNLPEGDTMDGTQHTQSSLSILSTEPLAENSPLRSEMILRPEEKPGAGRGFLMNSTRLPGSLDKRGKIVDKQPITFHQKVKSSGYGSEAPRKVMFQPKTSLSTRKKNPDKKSSLDSRLSLVYPVDSPPPINLQNTIQVADRPSPINHIKFSADGVSLACALGNGTAQVFQHLQTSASNSSTFACHSGSTRCVAWSHDCSFLLVCGEDKKATVWTHKSPDPLMTFSHTTHNFGLDKTSSQNDKDNPLFIKPVLMGCFYYIDKFVLLTSGNTLYMYKYVLDPVKSDIKRYTSSCKYKLVQSLVMTSSQYITAMAAVNSFHSYLTLCAGSDKVIEVFDMNLATSVRCITDTHSRPAHVVCLNEGSEFVSHSPAAYNLILTAATADCIKLWDLRSSRCVQRYEGHCNRSLPCGAKFSPCARYIATGSEDRAAYIFDLRTNTYLHKLSGHTDTVLDVEFHPTTPQLITATLDGNLRRFTTT